jgi:uncharacterized protein (DUF885 family)
MRIDSRIQNTLGIRQTRIPTLSATMKRFLKWSAGIAFFLIAALIALAAHTWYAKPLSINWFYNRVFLQFAVDTPEMLTQLRMLEQIGIRGHNARLSDASPKRTDEVSEQFKQYLETLRSYDSSGFTGQARLSYDILEYFLADQARGEPWRYHDFPVNQLSGAQSQIPSLLTQIQQVNDATDAEHYIARLNAFPRYFGQVIESIDFREQRGIVPPRFAVEKVITEIRGFVAPAPKDHTLTVGFKEKLDKIPADKMDAAKRAELLARVEQAVEKNVIPTYKTLSARLEKQLEKATHNHGAWSLPNGDQFYAYKIESNTTTKMSADAIHDLGLKEVARVGAEMDRILTEAGYTKGTRVERIKQLAASPEQQYADNDEGRKQVLADFQAIITEIEKDMPKWIGIQPKAKVVVKRVPEFMEKTAPAAYYNSPPLDGSQPGVYFANLGNMKEISRYRMRTVTYHEAIPGHHTQIAIAQELEGLPFFRSILPFTSYSEGWALYAEQLAWEAGFQKNPLDNLGRYQDEMLRAVRLVVDTGLHAKRWTREQAIEYMIKESGMPEGEVVAEIERYIVNPGQALAYKVGMLKILELRERAKAQLGNKFDIRVFHDEILKNGAMPMAVLERVIDAYIAREKGGGKT